MNSKKDSLGDRMKGYENVARNYLPSRIPVICRCDGMHFHTICRKHFGREWSAMFTAMMAETAKYAQSISHGCSVAYCQSDEITFLFTDYRTIHTEAWFDYNQSKIETALASACAAKFSLLLGEPVEFDARAFSVPQDDVVNAFIWRQVDATRNSIQMAGREHFSQKQLHGVNCNQIQEKLFQEKGINFNDYPTIRKRGFCIIDGILDEDIPIFTQDRDYIEKFVYVRED